MSGWRNKIAPFLLCTSSVKWTDRNGKNNAKTKAISTTGETNQTLFFRECTVRTNRDYKEPYLKKGRGERPAFFSRDKWIPDTRYPSSLSHTRKRTHEEEMKSPTPPLYYVGTSGAFEKTLKTRKDLVFMWEVDERFPRFFFEDFVVSCVPTYYCLPGPILILTLRTRNKHSWMGLSFLWTRKFVSQSWGFFESHCRSPNVCLKCLNCILKKILLQRTSTTKRWSRSSWTGTRRSWSS